MPARSLNIAPESPLHKKLVPMLQTRIALARRGQQLQHIKWQDAEETTLAYIKPQEADQIRTNRRDLSGVPSYTTIQVPYSYALLMSAHTYWTSVFFSRNPVHQFTGRHGEGEMQVQAMEALIGYQYEVGQFVVPYYIWLYDAGKYGLGILGSYWEKKILNFGQLVEMADPATGQLGVYQVTQEIPGYEGNCVYNVSPWDFFPDPRVPVKRFQSGEFLGIRKRLGWNQILERQRSGYFINIDKIGGHVSDRTGSVGGSSEGSSILQRPLMNEDIAVDDNVRHPAGGVFYEIYVNLVPKEWGVGQTNYPQIWCFTITEDLTLIVGATPLGMWHCQFPFDVIENEVEGYGLYSRGILEIMDPIQNTVDWLLNSHFYNVRQSLNNQFIVDPSKLVIKDVQNSGPGFLWRLRPEAYGTDLSTMFKQVDVVDVTRAHMSDFQAMFSIGERTIGINDQIMGSMGGNQRKTATEVRTTTAFGINRLKTISEYMSGMGFAPHSQKLVQTSQQMYSAQAKLKRVGSFAQEAGQNFMNVSPEDIVGFFDLVPVDGTLPIDRMAQANLWKEIMAGAMRMPPQIVAQYDWARIFAWAAQLGGLKNINQFKIQVLPPGMGPAPGSIPMLPAPGGAGGIPTLASPGMSASNDAGLNQLGGEGPGTGENAGY
jgi:hypothetical protein